MSNMSRQNYDLKGPNTRRRQKVLSKQVRDLYAAATTIRLLTGNDELAVGVETVAEATHGEWNRIENYLKEKAT